MVVSCSMGEALLGSQGSVRLMTPMGWGRALWAALRLWFHHDCVDLSAAFAYHAM